MINDYVGGMMGRSVICGTFSGPFYIYIFFKCFFFEYFEVSLLESVELTFYFC